MYLGPHIDSPELCWQSTVSFVIAVGPLNNNKHFMGIRNGIILSNADGWSSFFYATRKFFVEALRCIVCCGYFL